MATDPLEGMATEPVEEAIRRAKAAVERSVRAKHLTWGRPADLLHCETQVAGTCSRCWELEAEIERLKDHVCRADGSAGRMAKLRAAKAAKQAAAQLLKTEQPK